MLVLIDESGDTGFKSLKSGNSTFVMGMVIFECFKEAERTAEIIKNALFGLRVKPEFKFSKTCDAIRNEFFQVIASCNFKIRALVVDKTKIYSPHLRENKENFYNYLLKLLMQNDNGLLEDAHIKIDGGGSRIFKHEMSSYLRKQLPGKIAKLRFVDSRKDVLVQLADMSVGAIARSYQIDTRKNNDYWRKMLEKQKKIDNIWDFS